MIVKAALIWVFLASTAAAQGFAGLGTDAEGFAMPAPAPQFDFPADHGAHTEFRIEWWYVTANLEADGIPMGVQWTLFRTALAPEDRDGWTSPQIWFGHAAVTTPQTHLATERFARGGIGQAGVQSDAAGFQAWIDEWALEGPDFDHLSMTAAGPDFAYDLDLTARGPLIFHGDQGYSVKSEEGNASYYYAQPSFDVSGQIDLPSGTVEVTGNAWLDREWSSQPLSAAQEGWDWFSLTFDTGERMMAFRLRDRDGGSYNVATWIAPDGSTEVMPSGAFTGTATTFSPVAGRDIPTTWQLTLAQKDVEVTVQALNPQSWMGLSIPYWEGPVTVTGSHEGVGYLEMTGYD